MIRHNNRKVRLGMTLQELKNGKVVSTTTNQIKRNLLSRIVASPHKEFILKVTYGRGISNESYHYSKKDLIFALNAFTNKSQLDFIEQYWGR